MLLLNKWLQFLSRKCSHKLNPSVRRSALWQGNRWVLFFAFTLESSGQSTTHSHSCHSEGRSLARRIPKMSSNLIRRTQSDFSLRPSAFLSDLCGCDSDFLLRP